MGGFLKKALGGALIVVAVVATGGAAAIGAAAASAVGAGTISTVAATAIGAGITSGAITAVRGGSVSDVLKSAVIGGVTTYAGATIGASVAASVSEAAASAGYTEIAKTLGTVAGQTVTGATSSALSAAVRGGDPLEALIQGGLTAGLSSSVMAGVNLGTSKIEGFNELPDSVQRATKAALAAGALGKDPEQAATNSLLNSASRYVGSQLKDLGGDLKTAYDNATKSGADLQANAKRQEEIVADYNNRIAALDTEYANVNKLRDSASAAVSNWESLSADQRTQALADSVNAKIKAANDATDAYNTNVNGSKDTLTKLYTELGDLKTSLPTLEEKFNASNSTLADVKTAFETQEQANADILANTVKNLEIAGTTLQNDLGVDLSEDLIQQFVESGDVNTAATNYVNTTNQASQDLGFDNYKDQTAAAENDFTAEEADQWNLYKDTSGVVAGIGPGIETTGLGGQTDVANVFEPAPFETAESAYDLVQTPTEELPSGVETEPFQYTAEQLYQDVTPDINEFDLASYLGDTYQAPADYTTQEPITAEPTTDITDLFGEQVAQPTEMPTAEELTPESDQIARLIDDYYKESTIQPGGVQLASYSPSGTASDVGGLRALLSQPETAPTTTEEELLSTQPSLEPTTDLTAVTPGSATYSALTGTDPTKTITGGILGDDTGDVRGGIESEALYSGTEEELAPSDLITSRYFAERPETTALEDIGLTGTDQTLEPITLASATPATTKSDVLLRSDETTLPTSAEAPQTQTALKGTTMDENYDEYAGYPAGGFYGLPEGAEPESIISEPEGTAQLLNDVITIGSDIYRINPDGSAVGTNTETGEQFNVTAAQLQAMLGDQGFGPGEAGDLRGAPYTYKPGTFGGQGVAGKIGKSITDQFYKDPLKFLTAFGGAAAGAASKRKGITPRGLQSLQGLQNVGPGGAGGLTQTGAVGTKGRGGVRYFERRAGGGAIGYADGGLGYLKSAHDGMADQINATIDNKRPAKLSGGEFVIPADVVSHLGNGNSEAGAKQLYDLMNRIRKARTGTPKQGKQINPKKYLPK